MVAATGVEVAEYGTCRSKAGRAVIYDDTGTDLVAGSGEVSTRAVGCAPPVVNGDDVGSRCVIDRIADVTEYFTFGDNQPGGTCLSYSIAFVRIDSTPDNRNRTRTSQQNIDSK